MSIMKMGAEERPHINCIVEEFAANQDVIMKRMASFIGEIGVCTDEFLATLIAEMRQRGEVTDQDIAFVEATSVFLEYMGLAAMRRTITKTIFRRHASETFAFSGSEREINDALLRMTKMANEQADRIIEMIESVDESIDSGH